MRFFVAAVSLLVSMSPVAWAGDASVFGRWTGEMRQVDPEREDRYPMTLTFKGATGATVYPTLNCGGMLTKVAEANGGYIIYKETITHGGLSSGDERGCVDGVVIVSLEGGRLTLGWFASFEGEPMLASAVLTKASN